DTGEEEDGDDVFGRGEAGVGGRLEQSEPESCHQTAREQGHAEDTCDQRHNSTPFRAADRPHRTDNFAMQSKQSSRRLAFGQAASLAAVHPGVTPTTTPALNSSMKGTEEPRPAASYHSTEMGIGIREGEVFGVPNHGLHGTHGSRKPARPGAGRATD